MHLVIINATPTHPSKSNTVRYTEEFLKGFYHQGGTTEIYYLSDRAQWNHAISAFFHGKNILFSLPLYNAMIPGIMMEFLEELSAFLSSCTYTNPKRYVAFLLQSGFPESIHRQCCEQYLKNLPQKLCSEYSGILSHGNTFQIPFASNSSISLSYERMGELFADNGCTFFFPEAKLFNTPTYIASEEAHVYNRIFRFFCQHTAQACGSVFPLDHKPYETN